LRVGLSAENFAASEAQLEEFLKGPAAKVSVREVVGYFDNAREGNRGTGERLELVV
jgi:hypothetical protein